MHSLDLNDPIGFSEKAYSDDADNIFAISNSVIFGLKGNDIITSSSVVLVEIIKLLLVGKLMIRTLSIHQEL
jgi:hypothetical protein